VFLYPPDIKTNAQCCLALHGVGVQVVMQSTVAMVPFSQFSLLPPYEKASQHEKEMSQAQKYTPIIPALERLRKEDHKFQAKSLDHIVTSRPTWKQNKTKKEWTCRSEQSQG
jgi:hypothetical protein